jgi:peptidoglycan/xylan/chitin deacetylase (PgdA/CDA1 family)
MRTVVLTYHSNNISGNDYQNNDHVALADDLRTIASLDLPIVSLRDAVDVHLGTHAAPAEAAVAISCDDGSWFDWHDLMHPSWGLQPSLRNVLREFRAETGRRVSMTSFVIASPEARTELDRSCLIGSGWWGDEWWPLAAADGIDVQSHSWDHNHDSLAATALRGAAKGRFDVIVRWHEADAELRQASDYIDSRCGAGHCRLLAYPYGETSDYLADEYLPRHREQHRLNAAFTTEPKPLASGDDRWRLGRYVCGQHWRSTDQLRALLSGELGRAAC